MFNWSPFFTSYIITKSAKFMMFEEYIVLDIIMQIGVIGTSKSCLMAIMEVLDIVSIKYLASLKIFRYNSLMVYSMSFTCIHISTNAILFNVMKLMNANLIVLKCKLIFELLCVFDS